MSQLPPIKHKTFIAASPSDVYAVLTSAEGWDAWFTNGTTIDARPGGQIRFQWVDFGPDRITTEDGGQVLDAVPAKRLTFQWTPGTGPTTVSIELHPSGAGTTVELTETGHVTEEPDVFAGCASGWGEALTLLKFYIEHRVTYGPISHK